MKSVTEIKQLIAEKIPDGLVIPAHTDQGHFYTHTGVNETYGSVTTKGGILSSEHLKMWAASQTAKYIDKNWETITSENKDMMFRAAVMSHQDQFEEAGNIGTLGHDIIDEYLREWMETKEQPEDIRNFVKIQDSRLYAITRSAEMFFTHFLFHPIASELRVASTKYKFGGTLDALGMVKNPKTGRNVFALVDWKTSNSIEKPDYALQTSAYWAAMYEMTGLRPQYIFIVRLDKIKAKYEVMQVVKPGRAFRTFLHVAKAYDWLHNGEDKLTPLNKREKVSIYGPRS